METEDTSLSSVITKYNGGVEGRTMYKSVTKEGSYFKKMVELKNKPIFRSDGILPLPRFVHQGTGLKWSIMIPVCKGRTKERPFVKPATSTIKPKAML